MAKKKYSKHRNSPYGPKVGRSTRADKTRPVEIEVQQMIDTGTEPCMGVSITAADQPYTEDRMYVIDTSSGSYRRTLVGRIRKPKSG